MMVRVSCGCGQSFEVGDDQAGKTACCPACAVSLAVPARGVLVRSGSAKGIQSQPLVPERPAERLPSAKPSARRELAALGLAGLAVLAMVGYGFIRAALVEDPAVEEPPAVAALAPAGHSPPGMVADAPPTRPPLASESAPSQAAAVSPRLETPRAHPDSILLAWKDTKPFRQVMTCETRQQLKRPGQGEVIHQHRLASLWVPAPPLGDSRHFIQRLESARLQMKSGFQTIEFDSSRAADAASPLGLALRQARFDLVIQPNGRINRVDGADQFLDEVESASPEIHLMLQAWLNGAAQKHLAESLFGALPNRQVKPGESWVVRRQLPPLLGGRLAGAYRYTLEGKDGQLARIGLSAALDFQPLNLAAEPAPQVPNQLKANLTGTLWFDPDQGRIVRSTAERRIEGKVQVTQNDESTWVEVINFQKAHIEIGDGSQGR